MKYLVFLFCMLFLLKVQAQERLLVPGVVKNSDSLLKGVHVKNISSGKFSVSGETGYFQLDMRAGDTLVLTHVGMEDLISFIKPEDLQELPVVFHMLENAMELREVVLDETSEINVVSLGIIPKKIEKLSINERRLRTAGDFKPIHLLGLLGGSLEIDPILNAINGRTKRLKKNIRIEKERQRITFLEVHYRNYMEEEMELSGKHINFLIAYIINDAELHRVLEEDNEAAVKFFLNDAWINLKSELQE